MAEADSRSGEKTGGKYGDEEDPLVAAGECDGGDVKPGVSASESEASRADPVKSVKKGQAVLPCRCPAVRLCRRQVLPFSCQTSTALFASSNFQATAAGRLSIPSWGRGGVEQAHRLAAPPASR